MQNQKTLDNSNTEQLENPILNPKIIKNLNITFYQLRWLTDHGQIKFKNSVLIWPKDCQAARKETISWDPNIETRFFSKK